MEKTKCNDQSRRNKVTDGPSNNSYYIRIMVQIRLSIKERIVFILFMSTIYSRYASSSGSFVCLFPPMWHTLVQFEIHISDSLISVDVNVWLSVSLCTCGPKVNRSCWWDVLEHNNILNVIAAWNCSLNSKLHFERNAHLANATIHYIYIFQNPYSFYKSQDWMSVWNVSNSTN